MPHPFRLQKAVNVCKDLNLYKEDSPYASSVHADGKGDRLALSMQQAVALYDANTLQCIQILLEGKTASDASISSFRGNPKLATAKCGGALTEIGFDNHLLIGSLNNSDGSVIVWDSRTQNGGVMICQSGAPALSFSLNCSGTLLCSGTEKVGEDASICFWDMRNPAAKLGEFKEVHSDDVTQVCWIIRSRT